MDPFHRRVIQIGLNTLAVDDCYALAGGYAIQVHGIVDRLTNDVDPFAPLGRSPDVRVAVARVVAAYTAGGYAVTVQQEMETFARLQVREPATDRTVMVDLVAEILMHQPVASELGPVLHRDDVAAGKVEALFSRAEVRDFIDVDALLRAGYSRDRLLELAAQRDGGFDHAVFAQMLAGIARFSNRQFIAYGIAQTTVEEIRAQFVDWRRSLTDATSADDSDQG